MKKIDKKELHNIFKGIKSSNELYFNKLYEKYRKLIYAIAFSILKDKDNSEDVVQKVYIKIWEMDKQKLPEKNEASWLYTLVKNEAIDFIKYKKELLNIDDLYYIGEESEDINDIIDKDNFNRIISKLNTQEQEIISLKILSNLPFKEISQILNIPESTVKWKYYKSMHTLKLLLGNLGMFIITFTAGLKILLSKQRKTADKTQTNGNTQITEEIKENTVADDSYREKSNLYDTTQENTTSQTVLEDTVNENNYCEITLFSISTIFLILTIFFTIIFTKHQLKRKQKLPK